MVAIGTISKSVSTLHEVYSIIASAVKPAVVACKCCGTAEAIYKGFQCPDSKYSRPSLLQMVTLCSTKAFTEIGAGVQIVNPEIKDTPEAPQQAAEKLQQMGSMTRDETIMLGTMLLAVVLWVMGDAIGVPAVVAAMLGLVVLLVTGVLKWADCLEYKSVSHLLPTSSITASGRQLLIALLPLLVSP